MRTKISRKEKVSIFETNGKWKGGVEKKGAKKDAGGGGGEISRPPPEPVGKRAEQSNANGKINESL